MGVMVVIAGGIALLVLILGIMSCVVKKNKTANNVYQKICRNVYYNLFIRYIIQSTLKMQIATCTTISLLSWSNTESRT